MHWSPKKMLPVVATSMIAFTGLTSAADDAQMRNLENRVSALEQKRGANGMINPSAMRHIDDGTDLFFTGDFLWWKAHENGLSYAARTKNAAEFVEIFGTSTPKNKTKNPHFRWKPGFRIGAGYKFAHDDWDLYLNWTRFHDNAHGKTHAPSGGAVFASWIHPTTGLGDDIMSEAEAKLRLHVNMLDLEMGREFFVSKWLTLRPFVGLRSAWVRQRYKIEYDFQSGSNDDFKTKMKNNYWGAGLRAGLNTQWGLGGGWSIYGNAAISLLYGHFHLNHKEEVSTITDVETDLFRERDRFHVTRAITDLALGLRWDRMFYNDRYHFGIQAGWEDHILFGQNQFQRFAEDSEPALFISNQGDLTLDGWTVSARLDF